MNSSFKTTKSENDEVSLIKHIESELFNEILVISNEQTEQLIWNDKIQKIGKFLFIKHIESELFNELLVRSNEKTEQLV